MLAELHFVRPEWLWAIPVVLAVALLLAHRRLRDGNWRQVIDPALAPYVLSDASQRGSSTPWWLFAAVGALASIALAGPAFERIEQPVFRSDQAVVIALDMSYSMDAQDVSPSRLMRARLKILDLLERRASGQTALIVYSANAFTVTPLTTDGDTIRALANSLSTDIMPSRGSYPVAAIEKGQKLLEQAGVRYGEVLLITDGGASPAALRYAEVLRDSGYSLSVLGVGTREGAPIPKPGGGFITDRGGNIVVPRLEEDGLRELAEAGGGRYARLTANDSDLDYLLSGEVSENTQASDESLSTDQWQEEGPWLVLLLLPLAALAFRRGWVLVALLCVLPAVPQPAQAASVWEELFLNKDQQARRALESGDAATAAELFEDPEWRAVANYRKQSFEQSAALFAEKGDARSLYNLGNALAKLGELESAIDAYEQTLELEPDNEDAAYNRDLLKELLDKQQDEQQQSEQGEGEGQQSDSENTDQEQQQQGEQNESDSGDSSQSDSEQQQNSEEDMQAMQEELQRAAEEQARQQMSEAELAELRRQQEQEQAMEQWLRRIPNDPGGLLRRKFRYQYQRMGQDQDGNNLWPDDEVQPW